MLRVIMQPTIDATGHWAVTLCVVLTRSTRILSVGLSLRWFAQDNMMEAWREDPACGCSA